MTIYIFFQPHEWKGGHGCPAEWSADGYLNISQVYIAMYIIYHERSLITVFIAQNEEQLIYCVILLSNNSFIVFPCRVGEETNCKKAPLVETTDDERTYKVHTATPTEKDVKKRPHC